MKKTLFLRDGKYAGLGREYDRYSGTIYRAEEIIQARMPKPMTLLPAIFLSRVSGGAVWRMARRRIVLCRFWRTVSSVSMISYGYGKGT